MQLPVKTLKKPAPNKIGLSKAFVKKIPKYLPQTKGILEIPIELLNDFLLNPAKSLRDFASIPTEAISSFYGDLSEHLGKVFLPSESNIFNSETQSLRNINKSDVDQFRRYVHIDIGVRKDAAGMSMCHVPSFTEVQRFDKKVNQYISYVLPNIRFDLTARIKPPTGSEIEISLFRDTLEKLRDIYGYQIELISFDRYQSTDSVQVLRNMGFTVGHLSIDRTAYVLKVNYDRDNFIEKQTTDKNYATPHEIFRTAILEGRLQLPRVYPRIERQLDEEREWTEEQEIYSQEYDSISNTVSKAFHGTDDWLQGVVGAACNATINEIDGYVPINENAIDEEEFDPYESSSKEDSYENYNEMLGDQ